MCAGQTAGGRSSGRAPAPGRLDRAAFELAVADAAELLEEQLGCGPPQCRPAVVGFGWAGCPSLLPVSACRCAADVLMEILP